MSRPDPPAVYPSAIPFSAQRIRAAAVYCSDGRFGEAVDDLLHNALALPRYDRLAIPGGAACLAGHFATYRESEGVFAQLRFLIDVHELERIVLIAHENCAYYTQRLHVSLLQLESRQRDDIRQAVRRVQSLSRSLSVEAYFARLRPGSAIAFEAVAL